MKLFLFPQSPELSNGYGIVVNSDYRKLSISDNDLIIWYTNKVANPFLRGSDYTIMRPSIYSFKRAVNMLFFKVGSEVGSSDLHFLKDMVFESIFCGDVVFYRAIRELFPSKAITMRFHNCYSRISDRKRLLRLKLDVKFSIVLKQQYLLEQEIFNDSKVENIFISTEDKDYYSIMTGDCCAQVWGVNLNRTKIAKRKKAVELQDKLVWFGGIESHKRKSVEWFIKEVYPYIRECIPDIEFHLWGNRTQQFNNPKQRIFGHGFYSGEGLPVQKGALYVNPDIVGGGVKIKLKTYLEEGVQFITTPFGFEGYNNDLIDNEFCFVKESKHWVDSITDILRSHR